MAASRVFYGFSALFFGVAILFMSEALGLPLDIPGRLAVAWAWLMVAAFSGLGVFALLFAHVCERLDRIERLLIARGASR